MINFKLPTRSRELLSWEELVSWGEMYNSIPRYSISAKKICAKNTVGAISQEYENGKMYF